MIAEIIIIGLSLNFMGCSQSTSAKMIKNNSSKQNSCACKDEWEYETKKYNGCMDNIQMMDMNQEDRWCYINSDDCTDSRVKQGAGGKYRSCTRTFAATASQRAHEHNEAESIHALRNACQDEGRGVDWANKTAKEAKLTDANICSDEYLGSLRKECQEYKKECAVCGRFNYGNDCWYIDNLDRSENFKKLMDDVTDMTQPPERFPELKKELNKYCAVGEKCEKK